MDIFESLENLNVSEECFEDIIGLVEEILSENIYGQIKKVHGEPEYDKSKFSKTPGILYEPLNKSAKLMDKAGHAKLKELSSTIKREGRNGNLVQARREGTKNNPYVAPQIAL